MFTYNLRARRYGDRIPVKAKFSAPVQTGPGAQPTSCTMGTASFPRVKSGRGVTLTPHPLLVPWSRKSRAKPLNPLWALRPVQSLSACTRLHFTLPFFTYNPTWCSLAAIFRHNTNNVERLSRQLHVKQICPCALCTCPIFTTDNEEQAVAEQNSNLNWNTYCPWIFC